MSKLSAADELIRYDPWLEPYKAAIRQRIEATEAMQRRVVGGQSLTDFARGHQYFGLHRSATGWVFREWAPHATRVFIIGGFSDWNDKPEYELRRLQDGVWEIELGETVLQHLDRYKLHIWWEDGNGYRIPAYATRVVQDPATLQFDAQVWAPAPYQWHDEDFSPPSAPLFIYEAHIGMAGEEPRLHTFAEFERDVLPRVVAAGYNTLQLMAIAEHPYYGSFGYHVSNFFAVSSRFGTPDELKHLVDAAHRAGLRVIMDLVHSHAVKNEAEGLSRFDGTLTQYFKDENHPAWDSRLFDYGKSEVAHFLLSNCRYFLDEFHLDGFRFDGVTSMLYHHHGLEHAFSSYEDYFDESLDHDAAAYLTLANELIHAVKPGTITIAEDMSGTPGLALATGEGGIGFDYRLSMGMPDLWVTLIKHVPDEAWDMGQIVHELMSHRPEERTISYVESHDQALVGDKTLIFRLADSAMYEHMNRDDPSLEIDRAMALHKLIRLLTVSLHHGGYLTFMGNEFGHPEWIDFPREGNDWSYHYARRQWSLADDSQLKYAALAAFDRAMVRLVHACGDKDVANIAVRQAEKVIVYTRGNDVFVYNFHPSQSLTDYRIDAPAGTYRIVLSSDDALFGGHDRVDTAREYQSDGSLLLYVPARTALVLRRE